MNAVYDEWNSVAWKDVLMVTGYDAPGLAGGAEPEWTSKPLRRVLHTRSYYKLDPQRALSWAIHRMGEVKTLFLDNRKNAYWHNLVKDMIKLPQRKKGPFQCCWREGARFWNGLLSSVEKLIMNDHDVGLVWLQEVLAYTKHVHDRIITPTAKIRSKRWKEWCDDATGNGAKAAHGYLKDKPVPLQPKLEGKAEDAMACMSLETRVLAEKEKWEKAWACSNGFFFERC